MERIVIPGPHRLTGLANAAQPFLLEVEYLLDHRRRNRVFPLARAYQQGFRHRQGERQIKPESRSLASAGDDFNAAAKAGHFALQNIHSDATTRQARDFAGRREARGKNQLHHALRVGGFVLAEQAGEQAALAQPVEVEAGAVIRERQDDLVAFLRQLERDLADFRLALGSGEPVRPQGRGRRRCAACVRAAPASCREPFCRVPVAHH
jgi:hypothetical protein